MQLCQLCSSHYVHSKTNQELYKKHCYNQISHYEKYKWCHVPQYVAPFVFRCCTWHHYRGGFQVLHLKTTSVIEVATMKNTAGAMLPRK